MAGDDSTQDPFGPALKRLAAALDAAEAAGEKSRAAATRAGEDQVDRASLLVRIEELEGELRTLRAERDRLAGLLDEAVDGLDATIGTVDAALRPNQGA